MSLQMTSASATCRTPSCLRHTAYPLQRTVLVSSFSGQNQARRPHIATNALKNTENPVEAAERRDATAGAGADDISQTGSIASVNKAEVDTQAYQAPWYRPVFSRRREITMGRLGMVGFLSLQVGEILTGEGFFGQLSSFTGLPKPVVTLFLLGIVGNNVITALHPQSPTFSDENQKDVAKRNHVFPRSLQFGFTKENELNIGRLAMLGFGAATIGELFTGKGPAGQLGFDMGNPVVRGAGGILLALWIAFWYIVAQRLGKVGQLRGDTDIY